MRLTALVLALVLGCTAATSNEEFRDRQWTLAWIEGFDSMPSGVSTPTIRFGSDGQMRGNTACNSARASYTAEDHRLTVDEMITTKRACLDPRGNALERAYMRAVESARSYRVQNEQFELLDAGGTVLARFR